MVLDSLFESVGAIFTLGTLLRLGLLSYGRYQDAVSAFKYTDIDYFVFTDAARNVAWNQSPYARDTYRYTPLLAWLLIPTSWSGLWFDFGKVLFVIGDLIAGYLILVILQSWHNMQRGTALKFASLWLLNPMVATISTRGSSEGLLAVIVIALLWAVLRSHYALAGCFLGLAVHFKIYPFIYGASIIWWLDDRQCYNHMTLHDPARKTVDQIRAFSNRGRITIAAWSALIFVFLNATMFYACVNPKKFGAQSMLTSSTATARNS